MLSVATQPVPRARGAHRARTLSSRGAATARVRAKRTRPPVLTRTPLRDRVAREAVDDEIHHVVVERGNLSKRATRHVEVGVAQEHKVVSHRRAVLAWEHVRREVLLWLTVEHDTFVPLLQALLNGLQRGESRRSRHGGAEGLVRRPDPRGLHAQSAATTVQAAEKEFDGTRYRTRRV